MKIFQVGYHVEGYEDLEYGQIMEENQEDAENDFLKMLMLEFDLPKESFQWACTSEIGLDDIFFPQHPIYSNIWW